ncbi:MAG TPA: hypothetical protein EYH03_03280 [Chromatiales bacterium]|nr:hypothetical protein [Chromatiales bacterium]
MDICTHISNCDEKSTQNTPSLVPAGLILTGLVLLPFECIYNQALALILIGIGGYALFNRLRANYCIKKRMQDRKAA